jgi:Asp-tRNA(Asn)/Glu-tRNA(Gln) amidotransferase A subunit family amidase
MPAKASAEDLLARSIGELAAAFRAGQASPVEVTRLCLARIAALDPQLSAFITVTADLALEQARAAATELAAGRDRGHGVPIALKDLIDVAGVRTTAGSALFTDRVAETDADVVVRLRAAGAVLLGKLNLHEVAYGASGAVGHFPPSRNPRSPAHIAGGSSSGSAVAVAAGMAFAALGSDTSGSIRIPAALCGIVGLKPTFGRVSVRGVLPLAGSYDHLGPMTRSVQDAALLLQAIAAGDPAAAAPPPPRPPRLGVARPCFFAELDGEIAAAVEQAIARLAAAGAELRDVDLPVDDDRTVFRAESFAVHRRWVERSPELYQPETLRRIRTGATIAAADYIDKLRELADLRDRAAASFAGVDAVLTPTVAAPAPSFAELAAQPDTLRPRELALMRNTRPFNILGAPALSLPCGVTSAGLPVGLQIAAAPGADAALLRAAAWIERHLT